MAGFALSQAMYVWYFLTIPPVYPTNIDLNIKFMIRLVSDR